MKSQNEHVDKPTQAPPRTPAWPMVLTGALIAALLGALPFIHASSAVTAHIRRMSAELSGGTVPYEGSVTVACGALSVALAMTYLVFAALRRRAAWVAPGLLAVFVCALVATYTWRITVRDRGGIDDAGAVTWSRDLGALRVTFDDMTLVDGGRDGCLRGVVRTGPRSYEVFDCADGRVLWRGESNPRHPLSGSRGIVTVIEDDRVVVRSIEDGTKLASWRSPERLESLLRHEGGIVVKTASTALHGLDETLAPRWSVGGSAAGRIVLPVGPSSLLVVDGDQGRLLDAVTGQTRWSRTLAVRDGLRGRVAGGALLLQTADGVDVLDASNGKTRLAYKVARDSGPDGFEPVNVGAIDEEHLVCQRGETLCALQASGSPAWSLRARGETLSLREQSPGVFFVESTAGRLLGVEASGGRVTWEWWRGGAFEHMLPSERAPLAYVGACPRPMVQEAPGAPLCLFDTTGGRVVRRVHMPAGVRVRRVLDDGRQWIVLGHSADENSTVFAMPRPPELNPPT